jgi:hypothetical protein
MRHVSQISWLLATHELKYAVSVKGLYTTRLQSSVTSSPLCDTILVEIKQVYGSFNTTVLALKSVRILWMSVCGVINHEDVIYLSDAVDNLVFV